MPRPRTAKHGTSTMYRHHKCRCGECRAWNTADCLARRQARPRLADGDPRHGMPATYCNWQCRKACCREAWMEWKRRRAQPE